MSCNCAHDREEGSAVSCSCAHDREEGSAVSYSCAHDREEGSTVSYSCAHDREEGLTVSCSCADCWLPCSIGDLRAWVPLAFGFRLSPSDFSSVRSLAWMLFLGL